MYPAGFATAVKVTGLTDSLCGPYRPGHFAGVATVVAKLFNQVGPCLAVFGRKDYQQLKVVERMTRDLDLPVRVVGVPTVREPDGLALSSRNAYLSPAERQRATGLVRGLAAAWQLGDRTSGHVLAGEMRRAARAPVDQLFDRLDYLTVSDPDTLVPLDDGQPAPSRVLIAGAAWLGRTRLIDNVVLGEDPCPGGQ
jgi:pantoate--beta-alanine ligase